MSDTKIIAYSVYDIDVEKDITSEVDLTSINDEQLKRFVLRLANETSTSTTSRKAKLKDSSYAKIVFDELASTDSVDKVEELARQLLVTEKEYNKRIEHLDKKITSGNLIVAKVKRSYDTFILAAKIEFSDYLERKTFLLESGLPT